jgi:hypothetical protein
MLCPAIFAILILFFNLSLGLDVFNGVKPEDVLKQIESGPTSELAEVEKADVKTLVHVHAVSF